MERSTGWLWRDLGHVGAGTLGLIPAHNGKVLSMTEPQVWTVIGVFATALFGMLTIVSTLFVHVVRSEIGRIDVKIDNLDRDVQALMRHTFGFDRD